MEAMQDLLLVDVTNIAASTALGVGLSSIAETVATSQKFMIASLVYDTPDIRSRAASTTRLRSGPSHRTLERRHKAWRIFSQPMTHTTCDRRDKWMNQLYGPVLIVLIPKLSIGCVDSYDSNIRLRFCLKCILFSNR